MSVRLLLIDNYDSFTYNLVQAFLVLEAEVIVHRNDAITVAEARKLAPTHLVISPGPGRPDDAGVSLEMINAFAGRIPVLGVCLGHQSICQHFGGEIIGAAALMHGKTSLVQHDGATLLAEVLGVAAGEEREALAVHELLETVLERAPRGAAPTPASRPACWPPPRWPSASAMVSTASSSATRPTTRWPPPPSRPRRRWGPSKRPRTPCWTPD